MATTKPPRKARPAAKAPDATQSPVLTDVSNILLDTGSTVIEYVHGGVSARWLAICFSPDDHIHVNGLGYYQQPLRKAGFDVLAVKQAAVAGYADLTAEILADVLGQLPGYEGVAALGAEAGGFAAIRLLGSFEGLSVIVMSPRPIGDPGPARALKSNVYVAFDPKAADDQAACDAIVAQFPRVQLLPMRSAGAPTRLALDETGSIIPIMRGLASGQPIDAVAHFRANRDKSATTLYHIATYAMGRRHMKTAQTLLARATAMSDYVPFAFAYSRALAEGGEIARGILEIEKLIARDSHNPHYLAALGYYHELAGDDRAALQATRRAIQLDPNFAPFHIAERRLLDRLYDEMAKRNQMTIAALQKARGELAMKRGFTEGDEFDGRRMAALIAFSFGIVAIVAILAVVFRVI